MVSKQNQLSTNSSQSQSQSQITANKGAKRLSFPKSDVLSRNSLNIAQNVLPLKGEGKMKKNIKIGDICNLKITALGPNQIGIDEYSYPYSVLVPFTNIGDNVKAKIVKIQGCSVASTAGLKNKNNYSPVGGSQKRAIKFVIAKLVLEAPKKEKNTNSKRGDTGSYGEAVDGKAGEVSNQNPLAALPTVGDILNVPILRVGPKCVAISELKNNYKIFILLPDTFVNKKVLEKLYVAKQKNPSETVEVQITRVKAKYAFAKLTTISKVGDSAQSADKSPNLQKWQVKKKTTIVKPENAKAGALENNSVTPAKNTNLKSAIGFGSKSNIMTEGNKLTVVLPQKVKKYACLPNHIVLKLDGTFLFVKLGLGAALGDKVKIKLTKVVSSAFFPLTPLQGSPTEGGKGEQVKIAIAKIVNLNPFSFVKKRLVIKNNVREMLKSGMHFGEKAVKCHATMKNFVWLKQKGQNKNKPLIKKGRNIINLLKTSACLKKSLTQLGKYAAKGRTFLFVGTKKPAAALVARASLFSKTSFFVNTRWLGGMLTNWKTILKSISKIRPILKEKQNIIKEILTKRQNLKSRLIQKALLLRKKSKMLLQKGRTLIKKVALQQKNIEGSNSVTAVLFLRRKQLIEKGQLLLQTRAQLMDKKNQLIIQSNNIKKKAELIKNKYKILVNQLSTSRKKLIELQSLFVISKQIQQTTLKAKNLNLDLVTLSYAKFKNINLTNTKQNDIIIANPPKHILNKIVLAIRSYTTMSTQGRARSGNIGLKEVNGSAINGETISFSAQSAEKASVASPKPSTENNLDSKKKIIIISKLLSKFGMFVPYIRESILIVCSHIKSITSKINLLKDSLKTIKRCVNQYLELKTKINFEVNKINSTLFYERSVIKVVKRKLKQLSSETRLIKFLPKLRYLSTPKNKIYATVQILMKKIVDPKLKYPMDTIYEQKLSLKSKKVVAARKKNWQRLEKYFGGIANMTKMKKNKIYKNVAIIIGQQEELNAVRECKKLGIKMFNIVDTNCNPTLADHFIPANDDSRNSIKFILTKFLTRIRLAQKVSVNYKRLGRFSAKRSAKHL